MPLKLPSAAQVDTGYVSKVTKAHASLDRTGDLRHEGPVDQSCGFTFFFMYFITFFLKAKIYKQRKIKSSSGKSRILEGQKTFLKLFDSVFQKGTLLSVGSASLTLLITLRLKKLQGFEPILECLNRAIFTKFSFRKIAAIQKKRVHV